MSILFDSTMQLLERSLDVSLSRQAVTSSNIANIDTPGFTPRDIDFDDALQAAWSTGARRPVRTHANHMDPTGGVEQDYDPIESPDLAPGPDGNSVDLDTQMARMAETALLYQASARGTSKKTALMRYVVTEGMM